MSKRLVLKYRAPDAAHGKVEEYNLGGKRPPYLLVLKGGTPSDASRLVRAMSETHGKRLDGSPMVWLPAGAEFELWEVSDLNGGEAK